MGILGPKNASPQHRKQPRAGSVGRALGQVPGSCLGLQEGHRGTELPAAVRSQAVQQKAAADRFHL